MYVVATTGTIVHLVYVYCRCMIRNSCYYLLQQLLLCNKMSVNTECRANPVLCRHAWIYVSVSTAVSSGVSHEVQVTKQLFHLFPGLWFVGFPAKHLYPAAGKTRVTHTALLLYL